MLSRCLNDIQKNRCLQGALVGISNLLLDSSRLGSAQKLSFRETAPTSTSCQETSSQSSPWNLFRHELKRYFFQKPSTALPDKIRLSCRRSLAFPFFTVTTPQNHPFICDSLINHECPPHQMVSSKKAGSAWFSTSVSPGPWAGLHIEGNLEGLRPSLFSWETCEGRCVPAVGVWDLRSPFKHYITQVHSIITELCVYQSTANLTASS